MTGVPFSLLAVHLARQEPQVLAEKVTPSPTSSPSPKPTVKPTPKITPTPVPTQTSIPQLLFTSQQVNELIDRFAGQYSVSPDVLRYIATCESGFNPLAVNGGYAGLFQFGPTTWANIRRQIGEDINPELRFNAEEAAQTAAYALSQGKTGIWPNCTP